MYDRDDAGCESLVVLELFWSVYGPVYIVSQKSQHLTIKSQSHWYWSNGPVNSLQVHNNHFMLWGNKIVLITILMFAVVNTMSQRFYCQVNKFWNADPGHHGWLSSLNAAFQKLSASPQQTQGGSVSSPHPSQPSQEESSPCSDMSSYEEPPSPLSAASSGHQAPAPAPSQVPVHRQPSRSSEQEAQSVSAARDVHAPCQRFLPNDPSKWNVEQVYDFIRSLPGQWCKQRPSGVLICLWCFSGNTLLKFYIQSISLMRPFCV